MNLILTKTIIDNIVVIENTTVLPDGMGRGNYHSYIFATLKKSTGDVSVSMVELDKESDAQWTLSNLVDGHYKIELIMVPFFSYVEEALNPDMIRKGLRVIDDTDGAMYKALVNITNDNGFKNPSQNLGQWIKVNPTKFYDVYNSLYTPHPDVEPIHTGEVDFVFFNNIILAYTTMAKGILAIKPDTIYNEKLRAIRDKYEAIELAVAASNYYGAQLIIEASDNLFN